MAAGSRYRALLLLVLSFLLLLLSLSFLEACLQRTAGLRSGGRALINLSSSGRRLRRVSSSGARIGDAGETSRALMPSDTRLVLLDRDGVINVDRGTWVLSPAEFEMVEGASAAIAQLTRRRRKVAVVTNQSCVGRGLITEEQLQEIHGDMIRGVRLGGGTIHSVHFAPDTSDRATARRKPGPGMLVEAMKQHEVNGDEAAMIGDTTNDMLAATRAGVKHKVLVCSGHHGQKRADEARRLGIEFPFLVQKREDGYLRSNKVGGSRGADRLDCSEVCAVLGVPEEVLPLWLVDDLPMAVNYLFGKPDRV